MAALTAGTPSVGAGDDMTGVIASSRRYMNGL